MTRACQHEDSDNERRIHDSVQSPSLTINTMQMHKGKLSSGDKPAHICSLYGSIASRCRVPCLLCSLQLLQQQCLPQNRLPMWKLSTISVELHKTMEGHRPNSLNSSLRCLLMDMPWHSRRTPAPKTRLFQVFHGTLPGLRCQR